MAKEVLLINSDGTKSAVINDADEVLMHDEDVKDKLDDVIGALGGAIFYKPRVQFIADASGVNVNSGVTYNILSYSGEGLGDAFILNVDSPDKCEAILTVDGYEVYRVNLEKVKSLIEDKPNGVFYGQYGIADFTDIWQNGFHFSTSLEFSVKAVGSAIKIYGAVVKYRIKVT